MSGKKAAIAIVVVILLLAGVAGAIFLVGQQQDTRSKADLEEEVQVPPEFQDDQQSIEAQDASCPAPATVENVKINYPYCEGENCSTIKASCTWNEVADADKYSIKITEVDSNSIKKEEELTKGTSSYVFDVVENNTYRCEVTAIAACGTKGGVGQHEFTCKIIGQIVVPTPTTPIAQPTGTPVPTSPPGSTSPTVAVQPTTAPIPVTGAFDNALFIGIGSLAMMIVGGLLFSL